LHFPAFTNLQSAERKSDGPALTDAAAVLLGVPCSSDAEQQLIIL
jgi:hypothetical protein